MEKIGSLIFRHIVGEGSEDKIKIVDDFVWLILTPEQAKIIYEELITVRLHVYILHSDGTESLLEEYNQVTDIDWHNPDLVFGLEVGRISLEVCKEGYKNWYSVKEIDMESEK